MPILWLILGVISIGCSVGLYFYQEDIRHAHWSWSQLFTAETAIFATLCVGIVLLMVAIIELILKKVSVK